MGEAGNAFWLCDDSFRKQLPAFGRNDNLSEWVHASSGISRALTDLVERSGPKMDGAWAKLDSR